MNQFCETKNNDTIEPKVEPIMCPKLFSTSPHLLGQQCPRLLDSNINTSHPLLNSLYSGIKLYWQHLLNQFMTHLGSRDVYFVGDSLNGQMRNQMFCLEEFTDIKFMHHIHGGVQTGFPTPLNESVYNFSKNTNTDIVDTAFRQEWYDIIRKNPRIKYFVINTGMWWNPANIIHLKC